MPTPIQIPKTVSAPMDPDAPSLVTTLSVDVRLLILEVLFKRDEPFLLHNADAYHTPEPDFADYCPHYAKAQLKQFDHQFLSEIGEDDEFVHAYNMGIAVLLSCRQIYHEGVTILYSANEFTISRVTDRHDENDEDSIYRDNEEYNPFQYAAQWLSDIGSQYSLLRKVILDVDPLCPRYCMWSMGSFNLLPLARFIWTHPGVEHKISFARSARAMLHHIDDDIDGDSDVDFESQEWNQNLEVQKRVQNLNFMLSEIVVKDSLNLRQFTFSNCIIASIQVMIDSPYGWVHYSPGLLRLHVDCWPLYSRRFNQVEDSIDAGLQLSERSAIKDLSQLMEVMKGEITKYCFPQIETITFDMDKKTSCGISLKLFHISRHLRRVFLSTLSTLDFNRSKDVVISMTSQELSTDFDGFSSLLELGLDDIDRGERSFIESPLRTIVAAKRIGKARTYIVLRLDVATPSTLDIARIDIRDFCKYSLQSWDAERVLIRFILTYPCGQRFHTEEITISLSDLQRRVFLLLSDVLAHFTSNRKTARRGLPSIWINGRGAVIKASFPGEDMLDEVSVNYAHDKLNRNEVRMRGYSMLPLRKRHALDNMSVTEDTPLRYLWHRLAKKYWGDHEIRHLV